MKRREDLSAPRAGRRLDVHYDPDAFGRFSESIARFLGTARYLVFQSILIILWLVANLVPPERYQFDPWDRGLVLLTLVLSLQASYAAPLILLAQNRQETRDHAQAEHDRELAADTQAETEFLARELAGVRLMLADMVTADELREELRNELGELTANVERIAARLDALGAPASGTTTADVGTPLDAAASDDAVSAEGSAVPSEPPVAPGHR